MPSIATVTVLTASFMTLTTDVLLAIRSRGTSVSSLSLVRVRSRDHTLLILS
jgi:hypothetical protein